jgi:hypothetical protein
MLQPNKKRKKNHLITGRDTKSLVLLTATLLREVHNITWPQPNDKTLEAKYIFPFVCYSLGNHHFPIAGGPNSRIPLHGFRRPPLKRSDRLSGSRTSP